MLYWVHFRISSGKFSPKWIMKCDDDNEVDIFRCLSAFILFNDSLWTLNRIIRLKNQWPRLDIKLLLLLLLLPMSLSFIQSLWCTFRCNFLKERSFKRNSNASKKIVFEGIQNFFSSHCCWLYCLKTPYLRWIPAVGGTTVSKPTPAVPRFLKWSTMQIMCWLNLA